MAVNNVNERPVASSEVYTTSASTPLVLARPGLLANDTDPEGDTLAAVLVSAPSQGGLVLFPDGSFVFTPLVSFVGNVTFQYVVTDGVLNSAVQTVTISVSMPAAPANDGSGSGGSTVGDVTNSGNSSNSNADTEGETSDADIAVQATPVGGAVETSSSNAGTRDSKANSGDSLESSDQGGENRPSALEVANVSNGLWSLNDKGENAMRMNSILMSTSHSAVARLNAEQDLRLIQSLAHTVNVIAHLQEEFNSNTQVSTIEDVKFIAKTAIGSGVVVWVLHVSQVVTAFLAASSAWMHFDPLSILNASKGAAEGKLTDAAEVLFDNDSMKN